MRVRDLTRACLVDRFSTDRSPLRQWEPGLVAEAVLGQIGTSCHPTPLSFWLFPPSPELSRAGSSPPSSGRASPSRVIVGVSCSFPTWHIYSLPSVALRSGCETIRSPSGEIDAGDRVGE